MKSSVVKRSILIAGHKTSVSLENEFWSRLKEIARSDNIPLSKLVDNIDKHRHRGNLSSTLRLFVLDRLRTTGISEHSAEGSMLYGGGPQAQA